VPTERLAGVPADVLQRRATRQARRDRPQADAAHARYLPVMQYATDRALRESCTAPTPPAPASSGPAERDNTA
jgi:Zn-dependent oligopeptidase